MPMVSRLLGAEAPNRRDGNSIGAAPAARIPARPCLIAARRVNKDAGETEEEGIEEGMSGYRPDRRLLAAPPVGQRKTSGEARLLRETQCEHRPE